ncbi:MAG: sulfotransferase family 2 domain-containing protein [Alcanivoracaceae bacterium]
MYEFENLVYLDVQKTGSTHIGRILREALDERLIRFNKHKSVSRHHPDKVYTLSVRDPVSQYLSLFRYGCDKRGSLYKKLRRKGRADLYVPTQDGFENWLRVVLAPESSSLLGWRYSFSGCAGLMGFMSFRTLSLNLPSPTFKLRRAKTREQMLLLLSSHGMATHIIHNESLEQDLLELFHQHGDKLRLRHSAQAIRELVTRKAKTNVSKSASDIRKDALSADILALIQQREWPLYQHFGYG